MTTEQPQDPFLYVGRITRDESGRVRTLTLVHRDESITVEDGMEFATFVTSMDLEAPPNAS